MVSCWMICTELASPAAAACQALVPAVTIWPHQRGHHRQKLAAATTGTRCLCNLKRNLHTKLLYNYVYILSYQILYN
ncbi:hypothetical protein B484DRAFT_142814 [Ochromonadaceae sp. CCMP2298]|nr:hypothetical protein B484DRAFT_142814 [Ochromonadaceae sp. CCMP2298]